MVVAQVLAVIWLIVTAVFLWHYLTPLLDGETTTKPSARQLGLVVLSWALWLVGPPIWFGYEYFALYKKHAPPDSFDAFKYGQEQAAKGWAAIVVILGGLVLAGLK